jgi:hypothetical protein
LTDRHLDVNQIAGAAFDVELFASGAVVRWRMAADVGMKESHLS